MERGYFLKALLFLSAIWLAGCTTAPSVNTFATEAAQGGIAETQLSTIALQRSSNPEIKRMAQQIIDDHSKANTELAQLAGKKGVTLPREVRSEHRTMAGKLEKLAGDAFDRQYIDAMISDHEKDIVLFENQIKLGSDGEVKAFAEKHLPVLQMHLEMAREMRSKTGQ
jgi:putative membrane protein